MKKKSLLLAIAVIVLLSGCKSLFTREGNLLSDAKQAEKRGDYHTAVMSVTESIKIDNEYKKAIEFLMDVYPRANSHYSLKIDETRSAGSSFYNDDVVRYYEYLKNINEAVKTLPPVYNPKTKMQLSFTYTDYSSDLAEAKQLAAEDHYQEGLRLQKLKGRENAKGAAKEFETAVGYVKGYKDAEIRAQQALEAGLQILAFFPFINNAWNIPTAQFSDLMQNKIISSLMNDAEVMKFTKIIDRSMQEQIINEQMGSLNPLMDDASRVEIGALLNSNIFITGSIDNAVLEGPSTSMTQYHREVEIEPDAETEEGEGYYKNDSEESLYYKTDSQNSAAPFSGGNTVEADVFYYRKSINFEVTVTYKAIDVETGTILKSDTVTVFSEDVSEWAEWSGNEEALTWEDEQLINTYEESVMSAQQIASQAAEDAGKEIALGLASYLK